MLGDGETWNRQSVDFGGLPQIMQTFLQIAAGAADIPVTRLLGQSPAGLSATGDSDTRNYYDMIAARQALDLRPQLERLDALMLRSAGVEPDMLTFQFRPLWQLDASAKAAVALSKAQATAVYAGLNLWPTETIAALVRSQLLEDGTYPAAGAVLGGEADAAATEPAPASGMCPDWAQSGVVDFDPSQARDPDGRWTAGSALGVGKTALPPDHEAVALANTGITRSAVPAGRTTEVVAPETNGAHAPDGTKVELAGLRGRGRGIAAILRGVLSLARRLGRSFEHEDPDVRSFQSQPPNPEKQIGMPSESQYLRRRFTPEENAGLKQLFKGGGEGGNVVGAQRLLDQLDKGNISIPQGVNKEVLEIYGKVAQDAIDEGIDKLGVQRLRLQAVKIIIERMRNGS